MRRPKLDDARIYEVFFEVWNDVCLVTAKAALATEGLAHTGARGWPFDALEVTVALYGRVVKALIDAGEAGVEWRFTVA